MQCHPHTTGLAVPTMGLQGDQNSKNIHAIQEAEEQPQSTWQPQQLTPIRGNTTDGLPFLRHKLTLAGYDQDTITLMMGAWRESTKRLYSTYIKKWEEFTIKNQYSLLEPQLPQVCKFLRTIHEGGVAHGVINTARSALSLILKKIDFKEVGKQTEVTWVVKSVYEKKPPKPKYNSFWDVGAVFRLFNNWPENHLLSLKHLTWKLTMLLLLVSSQRGQTILNLSVKGMSLSREFAVFRMDKLLKHNRVGDPLDTIYFQAYHKNTKLCVVRTLKTYLSFVGPYRKKKTQLLLSIAKPHHEIKRDTIARWTLDTLQAAGIDTQVYKSHSTRGASASATRSSGVKLNLIMKHAGWRRADSFAKHYNKQIDREMSQRVSNTMIDHFDQNDE